MNDTTPVYNIVYQTICQINGKSYIGVHKTTDLNNGYIGCGVFRKNDANKNLSIAHTGKILSSSHRQKLSTSHLGQVSVQRKPIDKFSLSGEFIASYESIEKAALSVGCLSTSICNNLKKRSQNCSGFIFKYKEEGGTNCQ